MAAAGSKALTLGASGQTKPYTSSAGHSTYLRDMAVTNAEYMEHGHRICQSKFFN